MIRLRYILPLVCICFSTVILAQSNIDLAYQNFKEKNYATARDYIDKVIKEEGINQDPQVWQLRALIYKRLTKDLGLAARDSAMNSLNRAQELDVDGKFKEKIKGYRKNIVIDYYNDAVKQMEANKCLESESSYLRYKKLFYQYLDPTKDFSSQDVDFYLALSSKYEAISKNETTEINRKKNLDLAISTLEKVLELDKKNYEANLRTGILYYNQGVNLILSLTPDVKLEDCIETNKKSVEIFNTALPYFLTAYEVNPNKKEIVEGLAGIYTNLNDKENARKFVELLKQFKD